jgi:hypothetical protein
MVKISPFLSSGEFSMAHHFTSTTEGKCQPSKLQTIMQGGVYQGLLEKCITKNTQFVANILFIDEDRL